MAEAGLEAVRRWPGLRGGDAEISVLIPCWHAEQTIRGALNSVEAQQGLPDEVAVEIVVVIDGRPEDQRAVHDWIMEVGERRRWSLTMICLRRNLGPGGARQVGDQYCTGRFLAFLDDDDVWHQDKLAIQWGWHVSHPGRIASSHGYGVSAREQDVKFRRLLIGGYNLATPTLMIRRSLWPWEPEPYRFGEDWLMLAMIASLQPIKVLQNNLAWRSPLAPPLMKDEHSLSRKRIMLRFGKIRSTMILSRRGLLSPLWLPLSLVWDLLMAGRRALLDLAGR